jgi:hypothetical protein
MRSWMNITSGTSTALSRNGTRQPQLTNCSWLTRAPTMRKTPLPRITPMGTPICPKEPAKPLRSVPALSVSSSVTPPHCPPTAMPCRKRSATSRTGASAPIESAVGSRPMMNVAEPMSSRQVTSAGLRPTLSPKCPKIRPPIGRAMKPAQNVLKASRVPVSAEAFGKKSSPNTRAAAVA